MKVEVTMPEEYMGDVIGDINSRRGRIEGMDDIGGGKIVRAFCSAWQRCSDIQQTYVQEHRVVVTTQCSSKNMNRFRSQFRKKLLLIKQNNKKMLENKAVFNYNRI